MPSVAEGVAVKEPTSASMTSWFTGMPQRSALPFTWMVHASAPGTA